MVVDRAHFERQHEIGTRLLSHPNHPGQRPPDSPAICGWPKYRLGRFGSREGSGCVPI
jgi:hypothetical protein